MCFWSSVLWFVHADGILEWCKYLNNLKLFMRDQVEHDTALMRAIRKNYEFAVDELIKASAKHKYLDCENKVKSYGELQLRCYHLQCETCKAVEANLGLIIHI